MANVKVLYGTIIRRFTIPSDITWSLFESQIRSLFQIPPKTPIFLSYTDEDGDIITLSSDLELQEILSDQTLFGSSVKFVLSTPDELVPNEKNSWVLEGSPSQIKEDESPKFTNDSDVISFSSSDEEDGSEASPINVHESQEQSSNESQQPFMFIESQKNQDYKHTTVVDKETEEPTFKPTIVGQQPETIGESSSSPVVDKGKSKELPKKEEKQPESDQRFCRGCRFGKWHSRQSNRRNQCYQRRECDGNINEEIVAEKVKLLRDMGFEGENLEELINLYNGNMEFAVETLLQRQQLSS
ncbi:1941_t:CDS:2 [Racocetra fulgida]|uniref:1941_t:CDS:1 n=1 Tax=Racocetra fulgida TaxID=60492 RepID=A0A9N9B6I7_9GLOM|nr:1941_t:CDS:2 [Racocetra fulgida]